MLRALVATCVRVVALIFLKSCVRGSFPLALCFFVNLKCKGERLQVVEIPRKRDIERKSIHYGIQVDHWIT